MTRSSMMAFEGEISQKKLFLIVDTRWVVLKVIVLLIKIYFFKAIRQIDINQVRLLIPAIHCPWGTITPPMPVVNSVRTLTLSVIYELHVLAYFY
jgi:hypothetical protein